MYRLLIALAGLLVLSSHDMFLRLDTYFLEPDAAATVELYNGTFEASQNTIARSRMLDVSLLAGGTRTRLDTAAWSERDSVTVLSFTTGAAGTYVAGVSTRARDLAMAAADFNDYLAHEGGSDMLVLRKRDNTLDDDAVERYSKHVKAIFQVGEHRTDDWATPLGYPIEFVPTANPYDLHAGDTLAVRLLLAGAPLANQIVTIGSTGDADHAHDHAHDHAADGHTHGADDHDHGGGTQLRTDASGMLAVPVTHDGVWHMRTIHLVTTDGAPGLTHESNWATLTFEVAHAHAHGHDHDHTHGAHSHTHDEGHDHDHGIPSYVYWLGSLLVIGGLFAYFNRGDA